jgi:ribosome maturation factor RimP
VKATTADGSHVTGRVLASDEQSVTLDVDGSERVLALDDVAKARIQIEFNRKEG